VPHFEIVEVERLDVPHMNVLDVCRGWAAVEPFNELHHRRLVTFDVGIHPSVRAIANPPGDSKLDRLIAHPAAEKDALHEAVNVSVETRLRHV